MDEHPVAKHASLAIAILGATAAIWTRFVVVEERLANQQLVIAELTREVAALRAKVDSEERATRERFHASDLRLSGLEDHTSTFVITTGRRRRVR